MLAPFFGEIVSLEQPQMLYRIHATNQSMIGKFSPEFSARICVEETDRTNAVNACLMRLGKIAAPISFERYWEHMVHRLMFKRLLPERYPYGDTVWSLYPKFIRAVILADASAKRKVYLLGWGTLAALLPRFVAVKVIHLWAAPLSRPRWLTRLFSIRSA
jgi:hypothetical protein